MMRTGDFTATGPGENVSLAYADWGDPANSNVLLCVHGLTRNGRDFDDVAAALSGRYRVVCPDVVGRGRSAWLSDPQLYAYPTFVEHALQLIAHLGVSQVDWLGTSMGGLIGMMVAARVAAPIRRMVINDIGPFIPGAGLARLAGYVGHRPRFRTMDEAIDYLSGLMASFGPLARAQFAHLARHSFRVGADGRWELRYDPAAMAGVLATPHKDIVLWPIWEQIKCPILLLRGADSDILPRDTAEEMTRRGPRATLREFTGCGHAPALMDGAQIGAVDAWLRDGSAV